MRCFFGCRWLLFAAATAVGLAVHTAAAQPPGEGAITEPTPAAPTTPNMQRWPGYDTGGFAAPYVGEGGAATTAPCTCCNSTRCTKQKREALAAKAQDAYKGVFYANDFSYLDDPCYDGYHVGDSLKRLAGGRLDLGGEARVRYHSENNHRGLGLTGVDDQFWLTRIRLFSNWRINENFRFYGEYVYADSAGETFAPRPTEENRGDALNLFVDANLLETNASKLTARVGRQELLYGSQRLVSPLEWGNTRRTFDGYRLLSSGQQWNVDGFFTHPVARLPQDVDRWDSADTSQDFYGVYATRKGLDIGLLDFYYLGYDNQSADFDYHTIGSRVAGGKDLMYEVEGGVQFGDNSNGTDHGAGFFTAGLGRKLSVGTRAGEWNPTVWFWYDWASGGDTVPASRGDDSFDHLFPLAHKYNGFMDLFGRRNLNDVNASFVTPLLGTKVNMLLWYHYFFLDEKTTPYSVVMTPYNAANAAGDRELGHEIDLLFTAMLNPRNSVLVGYSFFDAGAYYDTTPGVQSNNDADFFYFQYQTQF